MPQRDRGLVRILHLEDDPLDAHLLASILAADGLECDITTVSTAEAFGAALDAGGFDVIVADYNLPAFDGLTAQSQAAARVPDVPFIFLSGTLGEETAVERMKAGAVDYVVKQRMERMPRALRRALAERDERRRRQQAEEALRTLNAELEARIAERTADLQQARMEADRANRAKSDFLSRMSHDLRTPLNAVIGFAQVLEIEGVGPNQAEALRQILSGAHHLLELINEVLEISKIEAGHLPMSTESVDLPEVVQSTVSLVEGLAARRGVRIASRHEPGVGEFVMADRSRVGQVLMNYLSNAIKYNREGGTVTVTIGKGEAGRSRVTVADQGHGIPASKLPLLFKPFERLGAEATAVEGTGLGLAVCKGLMEAMQGRVGATSVEGEGSTFWFELPVDPHGRRLAVEAPAAAAPLDARPTVSGNVIYIEDNPSNVKLLERVLRQRPNVRLTHFATGATGIDGVRRLAPDLLLLDRHLPDMTGDEVLVELGRNPVTAKVPVVMLTADAQPSGLSQGSGLRGYLTKPLDIAQVLRVIDGILSGERP